MNDLISRKAAIEAIRGCNFFIYNNLPLMHSESDLIDAIKVVPSATQWTPVEERLPEDDETVLCTLSWGGVQAFKFMGKRWYGFGFTQPVRRDYVLAWMPLPEPYKGGEE